MQAHAADLEALARMGRLRRLSPRSGLDFTSNDYIGLAESEALRQAALAAIARGVPIGAGGSRLLRGNHPEHEALESEAAAAFGAETALYFISGYMANFALFSTLPQKGDLVVHDALIHASVHEGLRKGRAEAVSTRHNDAGAVEDAISRWRAAGGRGRPWIAAESIYSMDGDSAPLADLMAIADRHDGIVFIDEAHATGVLGPGGRGLGARFEGRGNVVTLHTCGKGLGTAGALVCGPRVLRDFIVNRGRPFIFATAPSPLIAAVTRAAIGIVRSEPERRNRLARLVDFAGGELTRRVGLAPSGSHIMPVIVGEDRRAVALAAALSEQGFDVRAIRPPTVPEGTARLRIALTLNVEETAVSGLLAALAREIGKL